MSAFEFQLFDPKVRKLSFQTRSGETRVGEHLSQQALAEAKYVLIGICEVGRLFCPQFLVVLLLRVRPQGSCLMRV
mgnify:CR=1 FL=1